MGRRKRIRPRRLGEKLKSIRSHSDCSLAEMAERLSTDEFSLRRTDISKYELDTNEPPLPVLLRYARLVGITIDILADDGMDLPESFSSPEQNREIKRHK
jgi:transcriptional regulator with XRE-family HTH domain